MKKVYKQPQTTAIEIKLHQMIAASEKINLNSNGDALTEETIVASRRRRSLWDDEEEE